MDEKREKRGAKGNAIALTGKHGTDADEIDVQKENEKDDNENDETPELVINDIQDKSEGKVKTTSNEDEVTVKFKMTLDTWSATKNGSTDKIDTVMKVMITKDQKQCLPKTIVSQKKEMMLTKHLNCKIYPNSWKMES